MGARRADEQGVIAIVVALVTCFVMVPLGGLAVDIGMQRAARSDAQAVADVVAVDMSRRMLSGDSVTDALALTDAQRSSAMGSSLGVDTYQGYVSGTPTVTNHPLGQALGCGSLAHYDTYFQDPATAGKPANAVLVVVTNRVSFAIMGGDGGVCRSSIGASSGTGSGGVCYDVGSYAAAVRTNHAALIDPVLQNMSMQSNGFTDGGVVYGLSYRGLASSQISLDKMAVSLGLASVSQLAVAKVSLKSFYTAMAGAMIGSPDSTNLDLINKLASVAKSTPLVDLSKLLTISSSAGAVANVTMNALDLVGGSFSLVNGTNAVNATLASLLPGLVNAGIAATVIQGPHHFCGAVGDAAVTATDPALTQQLGATVHGNLSSTSETVGVPAVSGLLGAGTAVVSLPNDVNATLSVAPTKTTLTALSCLPTSKGITLKVQNGVATFTWSFYASMNLTAKLLGGLTASTIAIGSTVTVVATIGSENPSFSITVPSQSFDTPYPVGSSPSVSTAVTLSSPSVTATPYAVLTSAQAGQIAQAAMTRAMQPLFDPTDPGSFVNTTVTPMLGLLGTELGGADVTLDSSPAMCGGPAVKG